MNITRKTHVQKALKELVPHYDESRLFITFGPKLYNPATYTVIVKGERISFEVSNDYTSIKAWSGHLEEYFVTGNFDTNFYYRPAYWLSKPGVANELQLDDKTLITVPGILSNKNKLTQDYDKIRAGRQKLDTLDNDYHFLSFVGKPVKTYALTRIPLRGNIISVDGDEFSLEEIDTINRKFNEWLTEQGLKYETT